MKNKIFLFFGFPVCVIELRILFFNKPFSIYVLYCGIILWLIMLFRFFRKKK